MPMLSALALIAVNGVSSAAPPPPRPSDQLAYVENKGQWNPRAKFLAKSPGLKVWISDSGITYDFSKPTAASIAEAQRLAELRDPTPPRPKVDGHVVQVSFVNSLPTSKASASSRRTSYQNYLNEKKPAAFVGMYDKAQIEGIYSGIDVVAYRDSDTGGPRYDIVVEPGADLSQVKMRYTGAENLRVLPSGQVAYNTSIGTIIEKGLYAYVTDSAGTKSEVSVTPAIVNGHLTYRVPIYDKSKTLTIDPLIYSTYVGGSDNDEVYGVDVDAAGQAYLTGYTESPEFPTTAGAYEDVYVYLEAYVTKMSADGQLMVYSTFVGGSNSDYAYDVKVDPTGSAFVAGSTFSSNFPTMNAYQAATGGTMDAFLFKLNSSGSALVYSTFIGGNDYDRAEGVAIDTFGRAYIAGSTYSLNYPLKNAYQSTLGGSYDAFVTRFTPNGDDIQYSTYLGGSAQDIAYDLAVDSNSRAVIVGETYSTNYPTQNAIQSSSASPSDAFVTKLTSNGTNAVFSTYWGGSSSTDRAFSVVYDHEGYPYVGGETFSTNFPRDRDFGPYQFGGFVTKFGISGGSTIYSDVFSYSLIRGINIDSAKRVYFTGVGYNYLPPTPGAFQPNTTGGSDAFVGRISTNGVDLQYLTNLGGSGNDQGFDISVDTNFNAYIGGVTYSRDFPVLSSSFDTSFVGNNRAHGFLTKMRTVADPVALHAFQEVVGGSHFILTVAIPEDAGPGGVTVSLSGGGGAATLPPTVIVPEGSRSSNVAIPSIGVNSARIVSISASRAGTTASRKLSIVPGFPTQLTFNRNNVKGGDPVTVTGKVTLQGKAGPAGLVVYLSPRFVPSTLKKATIPNSVLVPAGATFATFPVTHQVTPSNVTLSVTGSANGKEVTGSIKIRP